MHLGAMVVATSNGASGKREWLLRRAAVLKEALESGAPAQPEPGWICSYCEHAACQHNPGYSGGQP
jgi:hypothetical protein